jgi:hypothetical protein
MGCFKPAFVMHRKYEGRGTGAWSRIAAARGGVAEWCSAQRAKDLWNSAGVGFYEHLFDSHRSLWPEMVRWLSPRVVDDCMGLWELRLSEADMAEVRRLFAERRKPLHQEARQAMRGI